MQLNLEDYTRKRRYYSLAV